MSEPRAQFIGEAGRRLFSIVDGDPAQARALLVLCPPLLHEQFLSYRLLAMMGRRLAEHGIATLRFDYYGSGDSGGDERELSLAGMAADTRSAIAQLRRRSGAPLLLGGVRAGAWPALACANLAERVLLWQPLRSGADWLAELLAADLAERSDRMRYPLLAELPKPTTPDWLLGSVCTAALRNDLLHADWPATAPAVPVDIAIEADSELADAWPYARQQRLPASVSGWTAKIDMQSRALAGNEFAQAVDWVAQAFETRPAA